MLDNTLLFLQAFTVNLKLGLITLAIGLVIGLPTAVVRHRGAGLGKGTINGVIYFLRAFPTYVLLFITFNILMSIGFFEGASQTFVAQAALVIALSSYTISACSDACLTFLSQMARDQPDQAWLIIPNVVQIFIVTAVSTALGAAIGVQEAVMFTIKLADSLASRGERILLMFVVVIFFTVVGLSVKWMVDQVAARLIAKSR